MSAFVIFDVEIRDPGRCQEFMQGVKPALEQAGARYLARGGALKVYEGDWEPRRIVPRHHQRRLMSCFYKRANRGLPCRRCRVSKVIRSHFVPHDQAPLYP